MRPLLLLMSFTAACSGASTSDAGADAGADAGSDAAAIDAGPGEYGFPLRVPTTLELSCTVDPFTCPTGTLTAEQMDHVCTLHLDGHDLVLYVQADPTAQNPLGFGAVYGDVVGYAYDRTTMMTTTIVAAYDFGGGHHNDFLDATIGGQRYRFYHSSFGFGFRACQPPDCVQKLDASGTVTDDGCTSARLHPEVCVRLTGTTIPPLTDTFERCPGDPNAP
ncbi:MAG: hypothetical protein IT378_11655 [Sandaracinaceae bacterium]|nr:hypothetical protein [Sandaracinaceae bacterium]